MPDDDFAVNRFGDTLRGVQPGRYPAIHEPAYLSSVNAAQLGDSVPRDAAFLCLANGIAELIAQGFRFLRHGHTLSPDDRTRRRSAGVSPNRPSMSRSKVPEQKNGKPVKKM
jgi:hypothetical protein